MNKLFICSVLLLTFLTGCGTSDGACCESMTAISSPSSSKTDKDDAPYIVKTGDPVVNPDKIKPLGSTPPVAVITPDVQTLVAGDPVTFSCTRSYDTDEQGEKIVACEWTFECHKKDGYSCSCPKKGNMDVDVIITPHPDSVYMVVTLKVTDDENEHNSTSIRYEVISK